MTRMRLWRIACEGSRRSPCWRACPRSTGAALAFDNGQYENVPPEIRAWFKGVIAPNGVPCCDIADGHRTEYDFRQGAYWVPIEGQWMAVPEHAVIRDRGNPVGEAVVWYVAITAAASSSAASCRPTRCKSCIVPNFALAREYQTRADRQNQS